MPANYLIGRTVKLLVDFFENDFRRISHAIEVFMLVKAKAKDLSGIDADVLVAASLLHDVGIKPSEEKLGYNNGKTQEQYGPRIAKRLLQKIGFPERKLKKVCEIIGNHHSPSRYDYPELKILKEADREVNKNELIRNKHLRRSKGS